VTPVSSIVEPAMWKTTVDGEEAIIRLPFSCAHYRTVARVVDFRPRQLEDFATWRKSTEADVLSDYGEDSDSDSESEEGGDEYSNQAREGGVWEWRFALQLEGVDPKSKNNDKFWVVVDNNEAQQLTGLDACE
jgi:protection of telomeres protein 1